MIECVNCETAQFLQIIRSRAYYDGEGGFREFEEEYECTACGATGGYEYDGEKETVTGSVRYESKRPYAITTPNRGQSA